MKKESQMEETKSEEEKVEKEQKRELPEKVKDMGSLVFFFGAIEHSEFLEILVKFKELNKELKITAILPLLTSGGGLRHSLEGYCVNCEEKEKEE